MLRWINGTSEFKGSEGSGSSDVISDDEDFVEGSGDVDDEDFNQELGSGEENLQKPPTIPENTILTKDKSFINLQSREQEKIRKKNWKKIIAKISPKIIPKIVQKSSQQFPKKSPQNPTNISQNNCRIALKSLSLSKCVRKCKKYKKLSDWELCMVGCRNYGVTKKTSIYLSLCTAKSNSM